MGSNIFQKSMFFQLIVLACLFLRFSFSGAQKVPAVFVFGDSIVDVGNNNHLPFSIAKANFPHNGMDFPTQKPTGRFNNGKNMADFLAEKVGLPTSPAYLSVKSDNNASFLTGVSFASGGAGIFDGSDKALGQSIPLASQVDDFVTVCNDLVQQMGLSAAQQHLAESLFAVVIGSNDLLGYFGSSDLQKNSIPQQYVDLMVATLKGQVERMHGSGARKFLFVGLGPLGCTPRHRFKNETQDCNEEENHWAVQYNDGLRSMLNGLKSELVGMAYSYAETYSVMQNIIQNPAAHGFTVVKSACCGFGKLNSDIPCIPISTYCSNRSDHVFWDFVHPTEATAKILVDTFFNGPPQYTFPINVRNLVAVKA